MKLASINQATPAFFWLVNRHNNDIYRAPSTLNNSTWPWHQFHSAVNQPENMATKTMPVHRCKLALCRLAIMGKKTPCMRLNNILQLSFIPNYTYYSCLFVWFSVKYHTCFRWLNYSCLLSKLHSCRLFVSVRLLQVTLSFLGRKIKYCSCLLSKLYTNYSYMIVRSW